ncbi:hypothetical protein [Salipiger bermudensis]|uniref:hypothetical protein n=1 Tax=Salipiger TaxID=263377 RepID=UPI001CD28099|nr:hypothetical protein [Salipiger bermudensis]MBR9892034.1 hypothetical protein [bacterium]MCA1288078.1 hypothetical protein [Salipiger bermudensis]MCP4589370.1 hypothetical protein [bacterium]|tara:strand:- start:558 stop:767 length:210 start_codon:yes stop_codon:yes gene_type:complete
MTDAEWKLFETQGAREVWQKQLRQPDGETEFRYRGEEYTELDGERTKVEETRDFKTQSDALAWLSGETG